VCRQKCEAVACWCLRLTPLMFVTKLLRQSCAPAFQLFAEPVLHPASNSGSKPQFGAACGSSGWCLQFTKGFSGIELVPHTLALPSVPLCYESAILETTAIQIIVPQLLACGLCALQVVRSDLL